MVEKLHHTGKKAPKKITKSYLENAALYYLQRYATSAANFKRVMMRKVKKSCDFHGQDVADFVGLVDELAARYTASGLLNDSVFAQGRVSSLRRKGLSKQGIHAKLSAKGLSTSQITAALAEIDQGDDPEFSAALAFVKRKRLGRDPERVQKDLAAMGRAGFSYEMARKALNAGEDD